LNQNNNVIRVAYDIQRIKKSLGEAVIVLQEGCSCSCHIEYKNAYFHTAKENNKSFPQGDCSVLKKLFNRLIQFNYTSAISL